VSAGVLDFHRMVIYAQGSLDAFSAKTAHCLIRYRTNDVVAVIDGTRRGTDLAAHFGFGRGIPVVASLAESLPLDPDALVIGVSPRGGRLTEHARENVTAAIERGIAVVNGMHTFLGDDDTWVRAAAGSGSRLVDLRRPTGAQNVSEGLGFSWPRPVVLTVGTDCNVGKMTATFELVRRLESRGRRARFAATGQTGILIAGGGVPADSVVSDFLGGAVEALVASLVAGADLVVVEGQGSIYHPGYAGVALGIMLGVLPDAMILCHHLGRRTIRNYPRVAVPALSEAVGDHEAALARVKPAAVIAVALNTLGTEEGTARREAERLHGELGLPVTDPVRWGPDALVEAVERWMLTREG
jgi:uncharacterized NAD-dependent epimerase/dehydratase family protein